MKTKSSTIFITLLSCFILLYACEEKNGTESDSTSETTDSTNWTIDVEIGFNPEITYGTMADQEGNTYKTVTIGTQTWMAENLRTATYNDSTPIPKVTNSDEWINLTTGAYCTYNNTTGNLSINTYTYGYLYNWYAVNTGKLAPKGWHVSTNEDWTILQNYLEELKQTSHIGGILKETNTLRWQPPNTGATNETGFTALPGGIRFSSGTFGGQRRVGYWWTATLDTPMVEYAFYRKLHYDSDSYTLGGAIFIYGQSIRCVKD